MPVIVTSPPPSTHRWRTAALAPVFLALVILLQWAGGAYDAEFGGYPDEPAHYVTAVMIRDYVAEGFPGSPMAFAKNYYDHYPKVALGNWPPLFYVMQSAWTLAFTPQRLSVLLLMAVLTAAVALLIAQTLGRQFGIWAGALGGLIFILYPNVQQHAAMVMTEVPVALFSLLATLSFGRYLETGRTRDSVLFGVFAGAAILTKGSGLVLAVVPVLAIMATGRYDVLRRRTFWYPAVIVLALAGPWTYVFRDVARAGWQEPSVSWSYTRSALVSFPWALLTGQSPVLTICSLIGLVSVLVAVRRGSLPARWAAIAGLVVAVPLFHAIVPASSDARHLVQALPAWAMLAVCGAMLLYGYATQPIVRVALAVVVLAGVAHSAWPIEIKHGRGFGALAEKIVHDPAYADGIVLVSSDATGEGMFIAETAMREPRPEHIIRRASKVLARQEWHGGNYQLTASDPQALVELLQQQQVRFVVIDRSVPSTLLSAHHQLLLSTAESRPDTFALRARYPVVRGYPYRHRTVSYPDGVEVYELQGAPATAAARPAAHQ
jgi:hypothetical protein